MIGYLDEEDIETTSTTETFAAITLEVETRRWAGVPFYLRTGKRLGRRVTEVAVVLKRAPHLPFAETATEDLTHNAIVFRIQPDEGATIRFGSKVPGSAMEIRDVNMDFAYGGSFTENSPEAYERLILDVLLGDPPLFPQNAEVELCWKILDPVLEHWAKADESGRRTVEQYAPGDVGPAVGARHARPRGPTVEAPMMELTDTNASGISAALMEARKRAGSPAMGMVMTLVVVVDEDAAPHAMECARAASQEHPARVLGVIHGDGRGAGEIHAQVATGSGWSGEHALIRLKGEVVKHAQSVVLPLLLPDSPVACWWPADPPADPAADPIGALAQRRITDAAAARRAKTQALAKQCAAYASGNTDLAWTRITPWRALLAAALDQHPEKVRSASVTAERMSPSADLLATWLGLRLQGRCRAAQLEGPGDHRGRAAGRRPATSSSRAPTASWPRSSPPASPTGRWR